MSLKVAWNITKSGTSPGTCNCKLDCATLTKTQRAPFYVEIGQNTAVQIKYPQILIPQEMRTPKNEYPKKWIHQKNARQNLQLDTYLISQAL